MNRAALILTALLGTAVLLGCGGHPGLGTVDLLLQDGKIWTGNLDRPWAHWIAVNGAQIVRLGAATDPAPDARRIVELQGRLVVPGFNDAHVHFAQAGGLLLGVNLLDASDDQTFRERIAGATQRLPAGSWITGGEWGAYEAWAKGSEGTRSGSVGYRPHRRLIDELTSRHALLVRRFDGKVGLANQLALQQLGLESVDGILEGEQLEQALERIPQKSRELRIAETRRGLEECRRWGVTSVQDMSPLDQVGIYEQLRAAGELTARIHFSPSRLIEYERMIRQGQIIGSGDEWLRFGTIKTHIDGIMGARSARFFEPYSDNSPEQADWRGGWREFSGDLDQFEQMLLAADSFGIQLRVHAIGDEANSILLDILERIERDNGPRDRRFRLVHAQVLHPKDFPRLREHPIVAEVQPYHCTDDMRWMEERIGHERSRGAYAFRSLADAGAVLAFSSDWPGTQASYYPVNPLYGLYAAVTRQTTEGQPAEGWFPEERIPLEQALRAYTWGGAYASFEERIKGTLEPGKLADLAVLEANLFEIPPKQWLTTQVDLTIVGGRIVYARQD